MNIAGFKRTDGSAGIRNHVIVLPTSVCASVTATRISEQVLDTVALPHQHGCCQAGRDHEQTVRTLIGLGRNPNVAAVLVVALGCEGVQAEMLVKGIAETGKRVQHLVIQESGGTVNAISAGVGMLERLARTAACEKRVEVPLSELTLAIECGGSDATSGIVANPVVGLAADMLIAEGGTVCLSETTELIGAEHILARRARSPEVAERLVAMVKAVEDRAKQLGVDIRGSQPTPGNIAGGITTIEEKSLGCIHKAGSATVQGILDYGECPAGTGLYVMDTPGQDIESITGMVAGGAQIVVFTTGRGSPTGNPVAPVIKLTGNSETYRKMACNIDLDAGVAIEDDVPLERLGRRLFEEIVEVANGKPTKAELLRHHEFGIHKIGSTL
jgi:altronate dehydratase large subunit